MATKEDILEQIVEEYLIHNGYFVQHNIKFLPRKDHPDFIMNQDSNHSDIDVLAYHPLLDGDERVIAVSCKSWQDGFRPADEISAIEKGGRRHGRVAWKGFRELVSPKWSEAFLAAIRNATGVERFTYVLAVSRVIGDKEIWENHGSFRAAIADNPIKVIGFREMVAEISDGLGTTLAATEVGRLLQMFRAARLDIAGR